MCIARRRCIPGRYVPRTPNATLFPGLSGAGEKKRQCYPQDRSILDQSSVRIRVDLVGRYIAEHERRSRAMPRMRSGTFRSRASTVFEAYHCAAARLAIQIATAYGDSNFPAISRSFSARYPMLRALRYFTMIHGVVRERHIA